MENVYLFVEPFLVPDEVPENSKMGANSVIVTIPPVPLPIWAAAPTVSVKVLMMKLSDGAVFLGLVIPPRSKTKGLLATILSLT